jgi:hypothetical protein
MLDKEWRIKERRVVKEEHRECIVDITISISTDMDMSYARMVLTVR